MDTIGSSIDDLDRALLEKYEKIWVGPGSQYENLIKTVSTIQYTRENDIPFLGTCGSFQHVIMEIAQNVIGFKDEEHAE